MYYFQGFSVASCLNLDDVGMLTGLPYNCTYDDLWSSDNPCHLEVYPVYFGYPIIIVLLTNFIYSMECCLSTLFGISNKFNVSF